MTANRWWVRLGARWLARVDGVSGQLRLAMLGMTGVSTATVALNDYGYGEFALPFVGLTGVAGLVFAFLYTEGGVWNQMARDRQDMSSNFAGPQGRINSEMTARAIVAGFQGEPLDETQREAIGGETELTFHQYSDGIDDLRSRDGMGEVPTGHTKETTDD